MITEIVITEHLVYVPLYMSVFERTLYARGYLVTGFLGAIDSGPNQPVDLDIVEEFAKLQEYAATNARK